jgi:hypothetical protein
MIIDSLLLFFGATFVYAGMLLSSRDPQTSLSVAAIGVVLSIRPIVRLIRYLRGSADAGSGQGRSGSRRKRGGHLKIVKSDKEKPPTYH